MHSDKPIIFSTFWTGCLSTAIAQHIDMSSTKRRKVDADVPSGIQLEAEQVSSTSSRESEGQDAEPQGQDVAVKSFKDLVHNLYFDQMCICDLTTP